jgi:hypothetical protein
MARKLTTHADHSPRLDAAKEIRDRLGPATKAHVAFKERLKAHYVATDRDERLKAEIEFMLENVSLRRDPSRPYGDDNRCEGTAVAIIAESGAGKSKALRTYLSDNPFFPEFGDAGGICPLILVSTKSPCTLRNLGMSTLRASGYPSRAEKRESEAWPLAHFQMQGSKRLIVGYEEAQRIIQQRNVVERAKVIETIAGLMTDLVWPMHVILSGLPELTGLFQDEFIGPRPRRETRDAHVTLQRRTRFVEFYPIDLDADRKDLDRGIRDYERLARVSLGLLADRKLRGRLCHAAASQFGLFWELTVLAIDACVRSSRKEVTIEDYQDVYAARTLQPVELNPFAVDHWERIDTSIVQRRGYDDDDEVPRGKAYKKPERRREDT